VSVLTAAPSTNGKHHTNNQHRKSYLSSILADEEQFILDDSFLNNYKKLKANFGYNGLGEFVFYRTYSRLKPDNSKEMFIDVVRRVVEGCYEIQRRHCRQLHIPWDYPKALESAHEMFERMWQFKFLPPGRGLWCMGTPFMWERGSAALNNCGFVSTTDLRADPAEPFCFLMDMSMLGVGVGFDTRGKDQVVICRPNRLQRNVFQIPDSREGWVESVRILILSFTSNPDLGHIDFDYSKIRPAGVPIKGFGGFASGPSVLMDLHKMLRDFLESRIGKVLTSRCITDVMNMIGAAVVAGNVRRTAEIAFGDADDFLYTSMKNPVVGFDDKQASAFWAITTMVYKLYESDDGGSPVFKVDVDQFRTYHNDLVQWAQGAATKRNDQAWFDKNKKMFESAMAVKFDEDKLVDAVATWNYMNQHRWASNNSVFAHIGMDYKGPAASTAVNGEPGYIWLENIRDYGRLIDGLKPGIDARAMGTNPCGEQTLESYELCNLVETFPANHDDDKDYQRTLKFAYLYAKTVTLLPTHNARTNQVMLRNRRIGLSQSGIVQAFEKFGRRRVLRDFCDAGYAEVRRWDRIYAEWLCIPQSIKVTCVKPSGTVSLVVGATPGIHYPEATYYWRHVRVAKDSTMVPILLEAGYYIEPALSDPERTVVIRFGVDESMVRPVGQVSMWEQTQNVADYQKYWTDNQPSCTVKFKRDEAPQIPQLLQCYEDRLKCISFLPGDDHGYPQAPYVPCTKEEVEAYNAKIVPIDFSRWIGEDADVEGVKGCDGTTCSSPSLTASRN